MNVGIIAEKLSEGHERCAMMINNNVVINGPLLEPLFFIFK